MTASRAQTVEILAADQILRDPAITEAQRLIGNVVLGHEDAVLTLRLGVALRQRPSGCVQQHST